MLISPRHLFDRLRHPRSRADELAALRTRFRAQPSRREAPAEQVALALRLRALRVEMAAALADAKACGGCAAGHPMPAGRWAGGHCCSGRTLDVFTPEEVASLKLAGTRAEQLEPPRGDHAGCAFRGQEGCSLAPADRPSLCLRYVCPELREELRGGDAWREVARLGRALRDEQARFAKALRGATPGPADAWTLEEND